MEIIKRRLLLPLRRRRRYYLLLFVLLWCLCVVGVLWSRKRRGGAPELVASNLVKPDCFSPSSASSFDVVHDAKTRALQRIDTRVSWLIDDDQAVPFSLVDGSKPSLQAMPSIADVLGTTTGCRRMTLPLFQRTLSSQVFQFFSAHLPPPSVIVEIESSAAADGQLPQPATTTTRQAQAMLMRGMNHVVCWTLMRRKDPRLLYVHEIISKHFADALMASGNASLARSTVVFDELDRQHREAQRSEKSSEKAQEERNNIQQQQHDDKVHEVRTSWGTFLTDFENAHSPANIALRVAAAYVVGVPESHLEPTQILRYEGGQYYAPHLDYFSLDDHAEMSRGGQRVATVLTWLNDVTVGGETRFPSAGDAKIAPRKGDAVVFYNVLPGAGLIPDITSVHAGEPPGRGCVKWVAVLWVHPQPYR